MSYISWTAVCHRDLPWFNVLTFIIIILVGYLTARWNLARIARRNGNRNQNEKNRQKERKNVNSGFHNIGNCFSGEGSDYCLMK